MTARLLFVSNTTECAGPTNSLLLLLRHMGDGFDVAVLVPGHGFLSQALEGEGIATISLPSLKRRQVPDIYRLVTSGGYDLVYGNNASSACRNAMIAAKLARVPFACHVRGMGGRGKWKKLGFLRLADAVIAVSEACARTISPYSGRKRLHVVHNGVELPTLRHDAGPPDASDAAPVAAGLEPDARLVVSVSHICPRKGQEHAVEAMARVVRAVPSAHLLLVGALDRDPNYVDEVERRIRELALEGRVSLLGFRRDVPRLIRAADVFLHTAVRDPHPRAVIEAMAAGVPVVAFDVDGVSETVESGSTGILCRAQDTDGLAAAMTRLLCDPTLRRKFGERGRRVAAERFSAQEAARRIERIIEGTLKRTPNPSERHTTIRRRVGAVGTGTDR